MKQSFFERYRMPTHFLTACVHSAYFLNHCVGPLHLRDNNHNQQHQNQKSRAHFEGVLNLLPVAEIYDISHTKTQIYHIRHRKHFRCFQRLDLGSSSILLLMFLDLKRNFTSAHYLIRDRQHIRIKAFNQSSGFNKSLLQN